MKIAVITPVGPGHAKAYADCLDSITSAWQYSCGKFSKLEIIMMPDLEGKYGRSSRRNSGIDDAIEKKCDWIFFLDADDLMAQTAFEDVSNYLEDYDAIFGLICEKQSGVNEEIKIRFPQKSGFSNYLELLVNDPFMTLQMGHFVKSECANKIKFDSSMDTGEDFKYYLELCDKHKFIKIEKILFINQRGNHSVGPKSANGIEWRQSVETQICSKIEELKLIANLELNGVKSNFRITNPFDLIQQHYLSGQFFEQKELMELVKFIGIQKTIVEIGANIGNHVVFYAKHLMPKIIFPFESNPESIILLNENIKINGISHLIDPRGIGIGLSDKKGLFSVDLKNKNNLDAAMLKEGGGISVDCLDNLIKDIKIDFIKIDVEGMELQVLKGARDIIQKYKPLIYIEIFRVNIDQFILWLEQNNYQIKLSHENVHAINYLVKAIT